MYVLHVTKLRNFIGEQIDKSDVDCYVSSDDIYGYHLSSYIKFAMMFRTAEEAKQTLLNFKDGLVKHLGCKDCKGNPMFSNKVDIYELKLINKETIDISI